MAQTMLPASRSWGVQDRSFSRAADKDDETDGAAGLFLFESRAKTVDAGIAVEVKRSGVVSDGVPVRVDQDQGGGEFVEDPADDGFHVRGENELNASLTQGVNGAEPSGKVLQEFTVVPNAS